MTGAWSEKSLFESGNFHQKVLLAVSGFGVIEVLAPNKSPIRKANSCCGFWAGAGAGTGDIRSAGAG